ncbi:MULTISPECIES: thioredoxin family protein [Tenacibaculum]|uniref:Thiol-disulfide isomerase n=1 Tax=Tenacibaculum discolor TaxID=361581 RepID=A0A2G1BY16_9FLAO|nr:thioredoxin family protein [Tenacibaculum discolor]MDP2541197.1 thioredoxin family protein [Tenacibaculum discolor]PHN98906.1 thiol-disulfide isomerase [Tenacibaculum discolor]PHN99436.1 thiol-disulfide isomerase [Rhodobacteraceae bacterium 4F10]
MNKITIVIFFLIGLSTTYAQDWQTDFLKAKEIASQENKPIILVFQGSDWCIPCMKLNKEVWNTNTFKEYAKEHYVMLQADFPRKKKNKLSKEQQNTNAKLFETYNKKGFFPLVVVLDKDGKVLGETGYKKTTPVSYIDELNAFIK